MPKHKMTISYKIYNLIFSVSLILLPLLVIIRFWVDSCIIANLERTDLVLISFSFAFAFIEYKGKK